MSQLQDYESNLQKNSDINYKRTPIEVIHTQQPEQTSVQVATQLEVKYLSNNSQKENSENNSPDTQTTTEATSYFKINQVAANSNSSNENNKCTNLGDKNSILLSN